MARRRFLPLIAAVAGGTAALIARLAWIQVAEHEVWADEAANLVRSGAVQPYRRGSILDAKGRELARDETTYRIQYRYREFRRRHPLGIVAHARSALLGAPVPYAEALASLTQWTDELLALTPRELEEFASGGALLLGEAIVPETAEPARERRGGRRSDVRFYLTQLFDLDRKERERFAKALRERPESTVLEIAAAVRGSGDAAALRRRLLERMVECSEDLDVLARALDGDARARGEPGEERPLEALVAKLEEWREAVADEVAGELLEQALGFAAGRIEPGTIEASVDLDWIAMQLGWDAARTSAWLARARERWREYQMGLQVERVATELETSVRQGDGPERVLDRWAELFASEPERVGEGGGWRDSGPLVVLSDLPDLFASARAVPDASAGVLPFQDPAALGAEVPGTATWTTVARAELGPSATDEELAALAAPWAEAFEGRFDADFVREHTRAVVTLWEQELQRAIRAALEAARGEARKLAISEERLDRAGERTLYVVKDRGSRPQPVAGNPSYATVHLLSRHADRFAGFDVESVNERVQLEDSRGIAVAGALVGSVGMPTYREVLLDRPLREDFDELRRKGTRTEAEEAQLRWLARRMVRADELRGRTGIEAYFDRELSGRNGYVERTGLQETIERRSHFDLPPEDGSDLRLTLDLDLQVAAVETLAAPEGDPTPGERDEDWLGSPTGAIVLMEVDGDVLAAASYPDFDRGEADPPAARDIPFERTLRKPDFQPPGSSFKVFTSAWALDHVDFDPAQEERCAELADGSFGYVDVRCHAKYGHGPVGMREAIQRSCNAYFARLGERFTDEDWRGLAAEFGFGRATGVHAFGARNGLIEDRIAGLFSEPVTGRRARLAGNGLAVVEATPMQLARATAGLATGELPDVRLVHRVGGVEVPHRSRPLATSAASLQYVREAMLSVSTTAGGSAYEALRESEVGFRIASKTGSGDIDVTKVDGRVRKHTWLIGYFPYEAPRYVVVVFCYDTRQTASHSAVWVARQLLRRPEVQALLAAGEGATR